MPRLVLSKQAARFLRALPVKQAHQIAVKLKMLGDAPESLPSEPLKGYAPMRRLKSGEFRIIYAVEGDDIEVRLIGKRNDDDVYKALERALKR